MHPSLSIPADNIRTIADCLSAMADSIEDTTIDAQTRMMLLLGNIDDAKMHETAIDIASLHIAQKDSTNV